LKNLEKTLFLKKQTKQKLKIKPQNFQSQKAIFVD